MKTKHNKSAPVLRNRASLAGSTGIKLELSRLETFVNCTSDMMDILHQIKKETKSRVRHSLK